MKFPDRRQASSGNFGEQLSLFEPPPFCPVNPTPATLPAKALAMLLQGGTLISPDFQAVTQSWRLAAHVRELRKLGWPVQAFDVRFPDNPTRTIAAYFLPAWVLRQVQEA
jgi:hypothetical protein